MTLTELSYYGRRMMPFIILLLLIFFIFFYAFKLFFLYLQLQQKNSAVIITNPIFGKIKSPLLKDSQQLSGINYNLDTIEGQPVTATTSAQVFFLPPSFAPFKYLQQIYLMAKTVGIDTESVKHNLVDTKATFDDGLQKIVIDIRNYNFVYEYNLSKLNEDGAFFSSSQIPSQQEIEEKAANFLYSLGRYPEELVKGKRNIVYLTYSPEKNELALAPQNETTNMVEVDFYRADVNGFPIVSPKYFNSQNYVIIAFSNDGFRIIKSQISFYEKSNEQVGTYPIKSGDVAWEELKAGKGIIVQSSEKKAINIKNMFLGYLDPDVYQEYLQPVYVFLGEDNFVGYVPAITAEYFQ